MAMSSASLCKPVSTVPLSVLIIGCGAIAGGYDSDRPVDEANDGLILSHAKAYLHHGGFRLAGCVEPDPVRRATFMERWGVAEGFADLDACQDRSFDVASVCVPTNAHAAVLTALLTMPVRAVFCEKPLTADLDSGRRLAAAYAAAGRPLMVNHPRRWDPEMAVLRQEIADGAWGTLQAATAFYGKGILNNGSHIIDLLQFLLGSLTPRAASRPIIDRDTADPTLDGLLENADGAPVRLVGTDCRKYSLLELDLVFEKGRVQIEDGGFRVRRRRVRSDPRFAGYRTLDDGEIRHTGYGHALAHAIAGVESVLREGAPQLSTADTALSAQETATELIRLSCLAPKIEIEP
ncbi:Gfo/Idh/MocA family protein [Azospirillum soli]|uniref:Gfo/Idh/MocA family protein n=1 Tax=Azospirillum soli TaxID=1304799 RepID=UPI001FE8EFA7|nr:Gfo/Idh/MocA family oxidoreductase [Azospirillum soli]MBP2316828.1 putative dehydrogenase [Azospirillum soli]